MAGTMKVFVFWLLYSSSSVFYVKFFFPSVLKIVSEGFVYSFTENKPYETQSFCSKEKTLEKQKNNVFLF